MSSYILVSYVKGPKRFPSRTPDLGSTPRMNRKYGDGRRDLNSIDGSEPIAIPDLRDDGDVDTPF